MNKIFWSIIFIFSACASVNSTNTNATADECTATVGVYSVFIDENSATGTCDSESNNDMFQFLQNRSVYIEKNENDNGNGCNRWDVYRATGKWMLKCNITHKYYFEYVGKTNISGTLKTVRDCGEINPEDTCKSSANFKFVLQ